MSFYLREIKLLLVDLECCQEKSEIIDRLNEYLTLLEENSSNVFFFEREEHSKKLFHK
jgi:hypothetical protein